MFRWISYKLISDDSLDDFHGQADKKRRRKEYNICAKRMFNLCENNVFCLLYRAGSTRLTNHRVNITEAARTAAIFGDPHRPSPTTSGIRRRHSVNSDDTMHIAWQALQ